ELDRVPHGPAEDRVVELAAEVAEADALAEQRSSDRVREAEVDRPPERDPERRGDEDDGRGDEEGREETAALSDVLEAPPFRLGRSNRCHVGTLSAYQPHALPPLAALGPSPRAPR